MIVYVNIIAYSYERDIKSYYVFYEYARKYEASSYKGLHDFVEYVSGIISQNTTITDEDAATDNTVRIMTVHKSKGLEFPIVFLYGADKVISDQDSKKNMMVTFVKKQIKICRNVAKKD